MYMPMARPGSRNFQSISGPGSKHQANLWTDRNIRHCRFASQWRNQAFHCGKAHPGNGNKNFRFGEILTKGPTVFAGYYKNEDATLKTLENGWLKTGDQGILDEDGHLVMIDRMKDVMQLVDGTKFSPQLIENKLKFSIYISEAVVVGKPTVCRCYDQHGHGQRRQVG